MSREREMRVPFLDLRAQHQPLADALIEEFRTALKEAAFVGGAAVEAFEDAFAAYCGVEHAVAVSSGTDALRLALLAAGIKPGDEVITAPNSFIATAEAISQAGAKVVFADIDPVTRLLDPATVESVVTSRTSAIIPVHLYGHPVPMDEFRRIADRHGLLLIEDAAQAHGAMWQGQRCGSLGKAAAFSFYPGKNLGSCGEGGAVTTNDPAIARRVRMLRDHGQAEKYNHEMEGYNARMHAIQARFLQVKLRYLDGWNESRRGRAEGYGAALRGIDGLRVPEVQPDCEPVWHLYVIEIPGRENLQEYLRAHGVATGLHYPVPLHLQPAYAHLGYKAGDFPVAERSARELLSLPMFPELTDQQIAWVADRIRTWRQDTRPE